METFTLVVPGPAHLPGYIAALEAGWSPDTTRDVCAEQLAAIADDPAGFLRGLQEHEGRTVTTDAGLVVPRLPGAVLWMWDGALCGSINFRHQPGTLELPPHVSGHIGYAVVPWKQRRGYATRALALMLAVAHARGLPRVVVTCDGDNAASRRVIEANGGVLARTEPHATRPGMRKLVFEVETASPSPFERGPG